MAISDFTGKNIQDTYQRVVQTDGTNLADGTGSLLPISFDGNNVIISGSLTATEYNISSSVTNIVIATKSGSTAFGDSTDDIHQFTGSVNVSGSLNFTDGDISVRHITASGNISASGNIIGNSIVGTIGTATQGTIDHDSLANFVANEHIDHSAVSVIAGTGLTGGGTIAANRTLNVIGGTGVTANANDIAIGQDVATTADVTFDDITSTGNISASGQIYAENVYADDILYLSGIPAVAISGTELQIGNANDWTTITYGRNTGDAHSFTGAITADTRKVEISSGTDGNHKGGDVVFFGSTTSMTTGAIYHFKSDGTWELADADDNTKSDGLLGVALGAASDTNGVLLRGMVTLDHDPGAVGDPIYLTTTAGDASATAPSGNGNIVRIIGYCLHASAGNIWFNPDSTFVEVSA